MRTKYEEWLENPTSKEYIIKNNTSEEVVVRDEPDWWPGILLRGAGGVDGATMGRGFLDHVKCIKNAYGFPDRKEEIFVISEPYDIFEQDVVQLLKFSKKFRIGFAISGNSRHNPGNCFRILFYKN